MIVVKLFSTLRTWTILSQNPTSYELKGLIPFHELRAKPWPKDLEDTETSTAWWLKRMEKENRRGRREEEARRGRKQSLGNKGHRGVKALNPTNRTSRAKDRGPESQKHWAGGTGAKARTATRKRGLCPLPSCGPHWWGPPSVWGLFSAVLCPGLIEKGASLWRDVILTWNTGG